MTEGERLKETNSNTPQVLVFSVFLIGEAPSPLHIPSPVLLWSCIRPATAAPHSFFSRRLRVDESKNGNRYTMEACV